MNKKIIITTITTIIITLLFIIAKNLIYGTDTYYIADYMPSFSMKIGDTIIPSNSGSSDGFASLAHKTTMHRLVCFIIFNILFSVFYTVILFKIKLYTKSSEIYIEFDGFFTISENLNEEDKKYFLNVTAATILYPYIRTFISNVTAFDKGEAVILPIVNFADRD